MNPYITLNFYQFDFYDANNHHLARTGFWAVGEENTWVLALDYSKDMSDCDHIEINSEI